MNIYSSAEAFIIAYLLGSIPTAVWIGKWFHNIDIREHGSGNAGATNVIRVLGWKTGLPVLILDLAKGWLATMIPLFLNSAESGTGALTNLQIVSGLLAITGHIFPLFAGFRGGKGVATMFGVLLALQPLLTISCMGVFLTVLIATGIVSVSSMIAGIAFPVLLFLFFDTPSLVFKVFSVIVAISLLFTHRKNIARLLRGEEKKLNIFGRKNKPTP
jgi:acyl phosphate:glycerol-3-phosphate acyltransferase